jgi:hypothetical protein
LGARTQKFFDYLGERTADEAMSIGYINFKDSIAGERQHAAYLECWPAITKVAATV